MYSNTMTDGISYDDFAKLDIRIGTVVALLNPERVVPTGTKLR